MRYRVLVGLTFTNDLRMLQRLEHDHHTGVPEAERVPWAERGYQTAAPGDVLDNLQPSLARKWLAKGWVEPLEDPPVRGHTLRAAPVVEEEEEVTDGGTT